MACFGLSIFWFGKVACLVALIVVYSLTTLWGGGTENAFSGVGQVLVIGGAVSNLVHFAILKRANSGVQTPSVLVIKGGLYRWVRHPMYLGELGLALGLVLMAPSWIAVALWMVHGFSVARLCAVEDRQLGEAFPVEFASWRACSWCLLPGVW